MRAFGKRNMNDNEKKLVSRMKAYQKMTEKAISRRRPNRHMIRRG